MNRLLLCLSCTVIGASLVLSVPLVSAQPAELAAELAADLEGTEEASRLILEEIEARVAHKTNELSQVQERQRELKQELVELQAEIARADRELRETSHKIKVARDEQSRLQQEIIATDENIRKIRGKVLERVRALYLHRSSRLLEGMVRLSAQPSDRSALSSRALSFSEASFLLSYVRAHDSKLLAELESTLVTRQKQDENLAQSLAEGEVLKHSLAQSRAEHAARLTDRKQLARTIETEAERLSATLAALKVESQRVEAIVAGLTGGQSLTAVQPEEGARAGLRIEPRLTPLEPAPLEPQSIEEANVVEPPIRPGRSALVSPAVKEPFEGLGLRAQRKQLLAPVKGTVVRGFGKQRHAEFSDFVFQRGVEIAVSGELTARAIADGRVVFVGQLPGFGRVVILDHGKRSYSLYGKLGESSVMVAQEVARGQELAVLIPSEQRRTANFYFEVRENGAPVNPRVFFPNL